MNSLDLSLQMQLTKEIPPLVTYKWGYWQKLYLWKNNSHARYYSEFVRGAETLCYQRLCKTSTRYFVQFSLPCWSITRGFVVATILLNYLLRMIKTISPEFYLDHCIDLSLSQTIHL